MRVFRITLAYDGTAYHGWQVQPDRPTIQATLETALKRITRESSRVIGSGRTDAGVHARRQVAAFRSSTRLSPEVLCRALNANTPDDIYVWKVETVSEQFHAIRDAVAKEYRYTIRDGPDRDVFSRNFVWHIRRRLNVPAMARAAADLIGRHDYQSFEAAGAPRKTSVRTVSRVAVNRVAGQGGTAILIEVEADGFLYNMVRNIVGTLVCVGRGDQPAEWVGEVLRACDRRKAGPTAPALGLTLWDVRYDREDA